METPLTLKSSGHVGHFTPPPEDSVYYEGEFFSMKSAPHPQEIKFSGFFVPPFIQFLIHANGSFTVFGPFFSILHECATKLNWSLVGDYPRTSDQREIWSYFLSFRPDVGLFPYFPVSETIVVAYESNLIRFGRVVGMFEMGHILSKVRYHHRNLLAMLAPFDSNVLWLVFFGLLATSFYAPRFKSKSKSSHSLLESFIWYFFTALIEIPEITTKMTRWKLIALTWFFGIHLLQQLFSGDMFTSMTLSPKLDVVNNWEDLTRTSGDIMVYCGTEDKPENFLRPDNPLRKQLSNRFTKLPFEYIYNTTVITEAMQKVSAGTHYLVAGGHILQQFQYQLRKEVPPHTTYISQDYREHMPFFIATNYHADQVLVKTFNKMIELFDENGIYNQWVSLYSTESNESVRPLVELEAGKFEHFGSLFVICTGLLIFAVLSFFTEILVRKYQAFKTREFEEVNALQALQEKEIETETQKNIKNKNKEVLNENTKSKIENKADQLNQNTSSENIEIVNTEMNKTQRTVSKTEMTTEIKKSELPDTGIQAHVNLSNKPQNLKPQRNEETTNIAKTSGAIKPTIKVSVLDELVDNEIETLLKENINKININKT